MAAFAPRSAKNAKVRIAGNTLTAKEWSVEVDAGNKDVSNFEAGGYSDVETELLTAKISITTDMDGNANPYDAPLNLQPGTTISVAPTKLYLNDVTGPFWNFPSVKVLTAPNKANVREMIGGTYTLQNKGAFNFPTGSF